ncbi:ribokinase [Nocardiopsis sp. RSe5-2]|uniref:Ribokinase n=1 Tax=Nocardiopsis endophytica TaxID=3018445 RepID=A0ABT4UA40_9ACTN|nr:ribokinase [Nocardiopsis endophytica]MDA2813349.1 ribokinase [Nocardiopsis endophytica]
MRIAVVGSYGAGLTMRTPRVPDAGETLGGGEFASGPGGKGSNQAIGAARLGADVSLLTAIGPDAFGDEARDLWCAEGVDASSVVTAEAATMVGVILVEEGGENRIVIAPGALEELRPAHVEAFSGSIARADLMMTCNEIPEETVSAALRTAREAGTPALLNPAPARELSAADAALVDHLTPNLGEARLLTGLGEDAGPEALLDALRRRLPSATIVLTCGADGAWADDGSERTHVAAVRPPRVADTTGAGDAFNAAYAAAVCAGLPLRECVRRAAAAGAFAVSRHEVLPGLGRPADLDALIR